MKLAIRRGIMVASFKIESGLLRNYKRQAETTAGMKGRETQIVVTGEQSMETACGMVDLMLEQYEEVREEIKELRRERRAERMQAKRAAEEAAAALSEVTETSTDETGVAESEATEQEPSESAESVTESWSAEESGRARIGQSAAEQ